MLSRSRNISIKEYNKYYSRAVICRHMLEMRRKEHSTSMKPEERKALGRNDAMRSEQKKDEEAIFEDKEEAGKEE